jgi:hypothetical protein
MFNLEAIESLIRTVSTGISFFVLLMFVDVFLGICAAVKTKTFEWARVADFYKTMIGPFVGGYLIFAVMAEFAVPVSFNTYGWENGAAVADGLQTMAAAAIVAKIGNSILTNAKKLFGKLPA